MEIEGRVALVTGASKRIGRALAIGLAEAGMDVAIHFRTSRAEAQQVVSRIEETGRRGLALQADLDSLTEAEALLEAASELGPVRVLVNNASRFLPSSAHEARGEDLEREFRLHVSAPFILSQAFASRISPGESGRIINLLDWRAALPAPETLPYSVAKSGLLHLTRNLAVALGPNITVNAVAPGAVLPPADGSANVIEEAIEGVPLGGPGSVDDVLAACLYLIRDGNYTTGAVIPVDGGKHLQ